MASIKSSDLVTPDEEEIFDDSEIEIEDAVEDDGQTFLEDEDGNLVPYNGEDAIFEDPRGAAGWNDNLAEYIDDGDLTKISMDLLEQYEADLSSRDEWYQGYINGLDLVGLKIEKRTLPWRDACGVFHPVLAEALIRYVSEAALELFPAQGPAEVRIIGPEDGESRKRAKRVKTELNYQLTKKMPENRDDLEMTLWRQALAGSCFRKVFKDPVLERGMIRMVPADQLVAAYGTTDLETCPRYTHVMEDTPKNDIMKKMAMGFYRAVNLGDAVYTTSDVADKEDSLEGTSKNIVLAEDLTLLEMYVDVDLPGFEHIGKDGEESGIQLPYIVTIEKDTGTILSIYRNHDEDKPFKKSRLYFSRYKFLPGFGFYGIGLIHVMGGSTDAATSMLRQLIDAGTMSNIPAGFKSRALRIKGDDTPLRPGELRDVDLPPGMVNKSIEWVPSREPSTVLAQLMAAVVEEGRRIGSITDMKLADGGGSAPVGTTLAIIERNMRPLSAVAARNYTAMDQELEMLCKIIAEEMPDAYDYPTEGNHSRKADFGPPMVILPVADPSGSTLSLRMMRYNAVEAIASKQPHLYDMAFLHRQMVETMDLPNAERIVPLQDDFQPMDPVTENMNMLQMRPTKAFLNQDHESHISVHMAAAQDPLMQQIIGQSPNAPAIQASLSAHIQEHVAYAYRAKIIEQLGMALPEPGFALPPEQEAALSPLIAQAAQQVLQNNQQQAAQQQAQEQAQDPVMQMKARELKIKEFEAETRRLSAQMKNASDTQRSAILQRKEQLEALIAIEDLSIRRLEAQAEAKKAAMMIDEQRQNRESTTRLAAIKTALDTIDKEDARADQRRTDALGKQGNGTSPRKSRPARKKPANK